MRQSKDYTQDNMAAELEITAGAYAKIERGETDPSATRLLRIAEILEVDVASFFAENNPVSQQVVQAGHQPPYGYASREELAQLTQLVKELGRDLAKLREQLITIQKAAKKGK